MDRESDPNRFVPFVKEPPAGRPGMVSQRGLTGERRAHKLLAAGDPAGEVARHANNAGHGTNRGVLLSS